MSKICKNCGKTVNKDSKYCPYCKSQSFRLKQDLITSNNSFVYKIFYWEYFEGYVLSKSKIISMIVFITFASLSIGEATLGALFISLIIAALVFIIGFSLHQIVKKPSNIRIINNDYGLKTDLIHLFFYWQNNMGDFVLSKTKTISVIIFIVSFIVWSFLNPPNLFALFLAGFVFSVPAFVIGYAIHKLTNPNPKAKVNKIKPKEVKQVNVKTEKTIPQKVIIPEYIEYQRQLDDLNSKYIIKEKSTRHLIEKRFEPPQLTYTRFISGVDKSSELFNKHLQSAFTMINLADEYSPRIASEIETKINILNSILDKLESLANELVLNDDLTKKEEVDNLIGEMDDLINSVHDYE